MKAKPKLLLCIVFLLMAPVSFSQAWELVYDSINSMGNQVILTRDSCYMVTGLCNVFPGGLSLKLDQAGNIIWQSPNGGSSVAQTFDNKYVISGGVYPDAVLKKIDKNGSLEWYKTYGAGKQEGFSGVIQSSDSCLVICGYSYNHGDSTFLAVKTDSLGNLLWSASFYSMHNNGFHDVIEFDHHYYIVGEEYNEGADTFYLFIVKLTERGTPRWQRLLQVGRTGFSIAITNESALIVAGGNVLVKMTTDGDTIWTKKLFPSWRISSVDVTPENGYIISGIDQTYEPINILSERDSTGEKIWTHTFPTYSDLDMGSFSSVKCTGDGGFITCGYSSYYRDVIRLRVLKTDSAGSILVGINNAPDKRQSIIHPNPTDGKFAIDIEGVINVEIFDINGKLVNFYNRKNEIDLSNCERGLYILRISTVQGISVQKIIKK
jgi:hypothetical protein